MLELVKHIGACRGGPGCSCPERDLDCMACREAHAPDMRPPGRKAVVVQDFRARRASGWRPPRERAALPAEAPGDSSPLSQRLRHARRSREWSQRYLAGKVRKSQSLICRWEKGKSVPDSATAALLWQVLGTVAEGGA